MPQYQINSGLTKSHRYLLGPPLFAALVFCFGFIMMQPHRTATAHTTASRSQANIQNTPAKQTISVPATQLTATQVAPTASNSLTVTSTSTTANPQSTNQPANLQSAVPNQQSTKQKVKVEPQKPSIKQTLTGLVNDL